MNGGVGCVGENRSSWKGRPALGASLASHHTCLRDEIECLTSDGTAFASEFSDLLQGAGIPSLFGRAAEGGPRPSAFGLHLASAPPRSAALSEPIIVANFPLSESRRAAQMKTAPLPDKADK